MSTTGWYGIDTERRHGFWGRKEISPETNGAGSDHDEYAGSWKFRETLEMVLNCLHIENWN